MLATPFVTGLALLALSATALAASAPPELIPVTVYFESYCPDSVKFLSKQLYPTFLTPLASHMNVTLVPYGKAETKYSQETGEYTFTCHHGEKECHGNKVIGCVLKSQAKFVDQFKFINCTSSIIAANTSSDYPINECAAISNLIPGDIQTCTDGKMGSEYLAEYGNVTRELNPALTSVPTVVFREVYVEADSKMAVGDFRKALCNKFTGPKPAQCTKNGAISLRTAFLPVVAALLIISRI